MIRVGQVIKSENGNCTIKFSRLETCKSCSQCSHASKDTIIELPGDYAVGSIVEVYMPDNQFLKASAIAYVFPLLMLILGLYVGSSISEKESVTAISAFISMGFALLVINIVERFRQKKAYWEPYILGIAHQDNLVSNKKVELYKINF